MISTLFLAIGLAASPSSIESSLGPVDVSLEFDGDVLDYQFVDISGDGVRSLCVGLRLDDGRRELRIFESARRGFGPEPRHSISILEDVLAYGFADVRKEPGKELLFITRSGAYSYSLTRQGYRGNIQRLLTEDLIYDVPDSRSLPYWEYTINSPGGDLILLPGRDWFSVWGPRGEDSEGAEGESADPYSQIARCGADAPGFRRKVKEVEPEARGVSFSGRGRMRLDMEVPDDDIMLSSDVSLTVLADGRTYPAPALVDLNGDGHRDLVVRVKDQLSIYLWNPEGIPDKPTRVETLPEYLKVTSAQVNLEFVHLNSDRHLDILVRVKEDTEGFENAQLRVLALLNDGKRLIPEEPSQVFRFEAGVLRLGVVDINRDGLPDLLVRKFLLPSILETVSGLDFEMTYLAYLGTDKGDRPFERKPSLNQTEMFDEGNFAEAIKRRTVGLDCDGDGTPDLVEVDLKGRIVVRRLRYESSFFSGDAWELDESAWKAFDVRGTILSVDVLDLNDDRIADIVSPGRRSLTMLLSTRGGK